MNDTIKRLAMEYKNACDNLELIPDCDNIFRSNQYLIVDSMARMVANAVLDAIESEAQ